MNRKCQFRKKNGSKCDADAQIGRDVCVFHDPEQSATVRRARRAGGIKRSRPATVLPPDTPDIALENASDVSTLITDSINQLRSGQLDPRVANGVGYLASVLLRSLEQGVMERRIAKLESSLGLIRIPLIRSDSQGQATGDHDGGHK
jgi:hypothetical protein